MQAEAKKKAAEREKLKGELRGAEVLAQQLEELLLAKIREVGDDEVGCTCVWCCVEALSSACVSRCGGGRRGAQHP